MPLLATLGSHLSQLLHNVIYSFPSPNNITLPPPTATIPETGVVDLNFEDVISHPGEPRAIANGIGPLSFVGSGYGITLVLMAILLNRIHHVVRRPRPPPPPLPHPPINSLYWRVRRKLTAALISHDTPKYIRLPGVLFLWRAWFLFSILTLQVAELWPVEGPSGRLGELVGRAGLWAGNMTMQKVCWQVFLSVCAGLVCSGLASGLDRGRRRDVGAGFNLVGLIDDVHRNSQRLFRANTSVYCTSSLISQFGYSFLLHLYSSPLTHHRPPPAATQGRPDLHALIQLWLSLTELTWLQTMELSERLRRNQLLPTAVCGTLGLAHFVWALLTSPLKFPSFTFLTHLMAMFLSIIILSSIILKAFTHIFTLGYLPSPVFANLLPHEGVMPSIEDDFGVVLLKVGAACLESTQYSGLRNELVTINEHKGPWIELSADSVVKRGTSGGFASEITQIEVSEAIDPTISSARWNAAKRFWTVLAKSSVAFVFAMILRTPGGEKAIELSKRAYNARWWYGPRQWRFWRRAAWRAPPRMINRDIVMRRLQEIARARARAQANTTARRAIRDGTPSEGTSSAVELPYARFLAGDVHIEDDEEEWVDDDNESTSSDEETLPDEEESLYRDLLEQSDEVDIQPVLLAHITSSGGTPLTRRRYNALVANPAGTPPAALGDVVQDRRSAVAGRTADDWDDDRRRCCVICTIEPRDTILWPCRCLAMCHDCRESLAARLPAREHMCPCCRRKVDGYSRLFIP